MPPPAKLRQFPFDRARDRVTVTVTVTVTATRCHLWDRCCRLWRHDRDRDRFEELSRDARVKMRF